MKTTTDCKRCGGGSHIPRYSHVSQGACFACGRRPEPVAHVATRAEQIADIAHHLALLAARGADWAVSDDDRYTVGTQLAALVAAAPADVAARARVACARHGLAV
jgi:hypothetical protein